MKKLLFLTKYNKGASREDNLENIIRSMLKAGFQINDLPEKFKYLEKEALNDK